MWSGRAQTPALWPSTECLNFSTMTLAQTEGWCEKWPLMPRSGEAEDLLTMGQSWRPEDHRCTSQPTARIFLSSSPVFTKQWLWTEWFNNRPLFPSATRKCGGQGLAFPQPRLCGLCFLWQTFSVFHSILAVSVSLLHFKMHNLCYFVRLFAFVSLFQVLFGTSSR